MLLLDVSRKIMTRRWLPQMLLLDVSRKIMTRRWLPQMLLPEVIQATRGMTMQRITTLSQTVRLYSILIIY